MRKFRGDRREMHAGRVEVKNRTEQGESTLYKGEESEKKHLKERYQEMQMKIGLAQKYFIIHSDTDTDQIWPPNKKQLLDIIPPSPSSPTQTQPRKSLLHISFDKSVDFTNTSFAPAAATAPLPPPPVSPLYVELHKRVNNYFVTCTSSTSNIASILPNKIPLTLLDYTSADICKKAFHFYYKDSEVALDDFRSWLIATQGS